MLLLEKLPEGLLTVRTLRCLEDLQVESLYDVFLLDLQALVGKETFSCSVTGVKRHVCKKVMQELESLHKLAETAVMLDFGYEPWDIDPWNGDE
jgi:hypothetical protein